MTSTLIQQLFTTQPALPMPAKASTATQDFAVKYTAARQALPQNDAAATCKLPGQHPEKAIAGNKPDDQAGLADTQAWLELADMDAGGLAQAFESLTPRLILPHSLPVGGKVLPLELQPDTTGQPLPGGTEHQVKTQGLASAPLLLNSQDGWVGHSIAPVVQGEVGRNNAQPAIEPLIQSPGVNGETHQPADTRATQPAVQAARPLAPATGFVAPANLQASAAAPVPQTVEAQQALQQQQTPPAQPTVAAQSTIASQPTTQVQHTTPAQPAATAQATAHAQQAAQAQQATQTQQTAQPQQPAPAQQAAPSPQMAPPQPGLQAQLSAPPLLPIVGSQPEPAQAALPVRADVMNAAAPMSQRPINGRLTTDNRVYDSIQRLRATEISVDKPAGAMAVAPSSASNRIDQPTLPLPVPVQADVPRDTSLASPGFSDAARDTSLAAAAKAANSTFMSAAGGQRQAQEVAEQVMGVIANRRVMQGQITLKLNPVHLGSIDIAMSKDDNEVHIALTAREAGTRELLEQMLPRMRSSLQSLGVNIGELDVKQDSHDGHQHLARDGQSQTGTQAADEPLDEVVARRPTPASSSGFYTTA